MPIFERSWEHRLVRGKTILPQIRDQGESSSCSVYASVGAVESAYKKVYAEMNQDFESNISIEYLISKFEGLPQVPDILSFIQSEGALTVDSYQQYLNQGLDKLIDQTHLEVVKIKTFVYLQPQQYLEDFVELMVHILSVGAAVGVFRATQFYNDRTVYYQDVGIPLYSDSDDVETDEESDVETDEESDVETDEESDVETDEESDVETDEDDYNRVYHAVLLISLGMDEDKNFYWRVLDSHGPDVGEGGMRRIAINLMKDAYIIEPNP